MHNAKRKALHIAKRIIAIALALVLLFDLLPNLGLTTQVQAATTPQPPPAVQTALAGNSYGHNGKFLAAIEAPVSSSRPIATAAELQKIGSEYYLNDNYHLTANIDLGGINWEPINDFTGTFDGQGYVIRNMTITGDYENTGLFGLTNKDKPVIKNLGLENVNINVTVATYAYIGGLLGRNTRGYVDISNCYVTGQITGTGTNIRTGGIVGVSSAINPSGQLTVKDCYNTATLTASSDTFSGMLDAPVIEAGAAYAGGIIGRSEDAKTISNCYNIGEINANSTGFCTAGGIVSWLSSNDVLSNCGNTGNVSAIASDELGDTEYVGAGGIIGFNATNDDMSTTIACYNAGNIIAKVTTANTETEIFAGGIGGRTHEQVLSDCYNIGSVSSTNSNNTNGYAGGIVGRNSAKSSVRRCYNVGSISGAKPGAVVGLAISGGVIRNSFWQSGSATKDIAEGNGGNTTAMTTAQMKAETSFPVFDFTKTWGYKSGENDGYPILQACYPGWSYTPTVSAPEPSRSFLAPIEAPKEGSIPIGSVEELKLIGTVLPLSRDYHLTANINLIGIDWEPIGNASNRFTGTFDGQGYAIHNVEVAGAYESAGLFGEIAGTATIKNLGLENVYINVTGPYMSSSYVHTGGLVGRNYRGTVTISNCYVTGEITATSYKVGVGGIIGYSESDGAPWINVSDCYNAATVTGNDKNGDAYVGGIIGQAYKGQNISNCHNDGTITATGSYNSVASGIVAWLSSNENISNCSNTGDVLASSSGGEYIGAGGIIGYSYIAWAFSISNTTNCYNTGNISALLTSSNTYTEVFAGGIGGNTKQQAVSDCYNTGDISAMNNNNKNGYAGGIVGKNSAESSVRRCYSTGSVAAAPNAGGIIGLAVAGSFTKDCFWNSDANQTRSNDTIALENKKGVGSGEDNTTPLTAAQMKQETAFANIFNLTQTWGFQNGANDGYPVLRVFYPSMTYTPTTPAPVPSRKFLVTDFAPPVEGSIPIATRAELENIKNGLDGTYHLTADIDLTGIDWTPIGDKSENSNYFSGTFDGQGHVITGMEVVSTSGYNGLFGYTYNANIRNVGIENACIFNTTSTNINAGGLLGYGSGAISNCYVTGQIWAEGSAGNNNKMYVGGIAGEVGSSSEVVDCYSEAKVGYNSDGSTASATYGYTGGIIGYASSSRIFNCHNAGEVVATLAQHNAGGVIGYNSGSTISQCGNTGKVNATESAYNSSAGGVVGINNSDGSITASYNTGDILLTSSSYKHDVGGVAGYNSGKINDCYNRGNVTADAVGNDVNAGGVVGNNFNKGSVDNCYSTGSLSSGTTLGGVAGNVASTATITNTFWNNESSQTLNGYQFTPALRMGIGIGTGSATGLSTAQMKQQASFTNFDFDAIWQIASDQNEGYPMPRRQASVYIVELKNDYGGTSNTGTGGGCHAKGDTVTITAPTALTNYRFKEWVSTDVTFTDKNSAQTTFVMPAKSFTVTATYEQIPYYKVTYVKASGSTSWREGDTVTITASTAAAGKQFKEWSADGADIVFADKNNKSTTFIMPARAVTIEAIYEDINYTITVNDGTASSKTATYTATVTITAAAPPAGKRFNRWTSSSGVSFKDTYSAVTTFVMPAKDVTVTATYTDAVKEYQAAPSAPTLASKTSTSVTLKTISGAEYRRGSGAWQDSPVFSGLSPDTNYYFYARLKETTTHKVSSASSSLSVRTDAKSDTTTTRTVTVKGGYAGSSSGAGTYAQGATVTIKAGKRSGYTFTGWTVNAGGVTLAKRTNATTTFTMKTSAVTVTANWKRTAAVKPSIKAQPKAPGGKLKRNAKYTLKISAKASPGKLTYQWQSSTKQNSGFKNIAGSAAKKASYSVSTKKKGTTYYRCVVTNTDSTAVTKKTSVTSKVAKVIVK